MTTDRLSIENYFQDQTLGQYVTFLQNSKLTKSSIKRKLSSLSSFRQFLVKKKFVTIESQPVQFRQISKSSLIIKPRRHNFFQNILGQFKTKSTV
jgi:site-specific recombinase XerD